MNDKPGNPFKFWEELKRRKVVRVITVYAAAAFVIIELTNNITEPLKLPEWVPTLVIVLLAIGFIITIVLSWIFDITPEGIRKTEPKYQVTAHEAQQVTSRGWKISTYISGLIIVAYIVFYIIGNVGRSSDISKLEKSIAVLPFENWNSDEEYVHMGDAITDELILKLQKIKEFDRVLSRSSTMQYKEDRPTIPEIAEKLGVNYIIEGSIQRHGEDVSIQVKVIRAKNEDLIWADRFDRVWNDIFSIQDEIAFEVSRKLKTALSPEEILSIEKKPTENTEAYNLYLKGRYFWIKRTESGIRDAMSYFIDAINKDSTYALAYSGLADCYNMIAVYEYVLSSDEIKDNYQKGKEAALKALEIDSTLAEAFTSLAYNMAGFEGNWEGAAEAYEQAILLDPDYGTAHQWYSYNLHILGQPEKAIIEARHALEIDPFSGPTNRTVCRNYYFNRDYNRTIQLCIQALSVAPEYFPTYETLGLTYLQKGMFSEAILEMEKAIKYSENSIGMKAILGYTYGVTGNQEDAHLILKNLLETSKEKFVSSHQISLIYLGLKDIDNTIKYLEKAYDENIHRLSYLSIDPIYDPLRTDPRFISLLKKMNLE